MARAYSTARGAVGRIAAGIALPGCVGCDIEPPAAVPAHSNTGARRMSGHNRWSKIKHKKAASDAKKSKGWTKLLKEITVAARGGSDPAGNARLRAAVDKARADNIPHDTISRSIKKGAGELEAVTYEDLLYEVYGPGGAAVVVEILTDNRNRTASELRHLIEKMNGKLAASGAVLYQFKKRGQIVFEAGTVDEDKLMEAALEAGAEDLQTQDGVVQVLTEPGAYLDVKEKLEKMGFKPAGGDVSMIPEATTHLEGRDAEQMAKLINSLEDHDDVQNVYSNADIDESVFEALGG
jgi:YebC/PmpR family DNA-binding regulatory protein